MSSEMCSLPSNRPVDVDDLNTGLRQQVGNALGSCLAFFDHRPYKQLCLTDGGDDNGGLPGFDALEDRKQQVE
jgi:hypothetical protein